MNKVFYGIIILFTILFTISFTISFLPALAQTNPVTIQTDDNNYDEGDTIVISGQVETVVTGTPVVLQIFYQGNMIDVAQITVAKDGSYSHTEIAEGPLWHKAGSYIIRASYGEGNVAETEFSFAPKTDKPVTTDIFEVDAGSSGTFDVKYTIKGGTVKDMTVISDDFSMVVKIESTDEGVITLDLPREFIGAEKQDGKDEVFIILIDDIEVPYQELVTNSDSRTITINFEQGDSDIKIIGTYAIPEFGAVVMMILVIGIMATITISRNKFQLKIN